MRHSPAPHSVRCRPPSKNMSTSNSPHADDPNRFLNTSAACAHSLVHFAASQATHTHTHTHTHHYRQTLSQVICACKISCFLCPCICFASSAGMHACLCGCACMQACICMQASINGNMRMYRCMHEALPQPFLESKLDDLDSPKKCKS